MTNITRRTALRGATAAFAAIGLSSAQILETAATEQRSASERAPDLSIPPQTRDLIKQWNEASDHTTALWDELCVLPKHSAARMKLETAWVEAYNDREAIFGKMLRALRSGASS